MKRKPAQGLLNVLRFNWHFYVLVIIAFIMIALSKYLLSETYSPFINLILIGLTMTMIVSLVVTYYVYDASPLYTMQWLNMKCDSGCIMVNMHAGFDETSKLLQEKFKHATMHVFDFYNPATHTEVSIKRARKVYPPYPGTVVIETSLIPMADKRVNFVMLWMAAHEIRNSTERDVFFNEINRVLAINGKVILVEHIRDVNNFLAYNLGAFHFQSASTWKKAFAKSGLAISDVQKITPFVTVYYLTKNGNTN